MKILLLTVCLVLLALENNAEDSPTITGDWYTIALASNVTSKIEEGGSLRMFVRNISENGDTLHGDFFKRVEGKCIPFSVTASKGEDGHMHVKYDGDNIFNIKSLDSDQAIFILKNTKNEKVTIWGELYGRTPDVSEEIKKKFEKICEEAGIRKDQIIDLSSDDRCGKLR